MEKGAAIAQTSRMLAELKVDPMVIVVYYLIDAATTTDRTAVIHSKQLNQNASQQQLLNEEESGLKFAPVPTLIANKHTITVNGKKQTYYTYPNQDAIDNANAVNQEILAQRQRASDQLTLLQQTAQIGESGVNNTTNEASQTMQEDQYIVQIVRTLTFLALLRKQPQQ
jgi:hypothetical protein